MFVADVTASSWPWQKRTGISSGKTQTFALTSPLSHLVLNTALLLHRATPAGLAKSLRSYRGSRSAGSKHPNARWTEEVTGAATSATHCQGCCKRWQGCSRCWRQGVAHQQSQQAAAPKGKRRHKKKKRSAGSTALLSTHRARREDGVRLGMAQAVLVKALPVRLAVACRGRSHPDAPCSARICLFSGFR